VLVAELTGGEAGEYEQVFEHIQKTYEWIPHKVPLAEWSGRRVRLKFVSDCGPNDNATTDHSSWGDATVVGRRGRETVTSPVRYMTWLGRQEFKAGFYFRDVRSETIDLELVAEGSEPVTIRSIRAFAHPDAIYREFEHGLVLANPSPRPYEFDLEKLLPGRAFRRLKGSALQDPATNDGSPVGGSVTLEPMEGLFLVKTSPASGDSAR